MSATEQARATLPRVARIVPEGGQTVRLELESGEVVTLQEGVRASLTPPQPDGLSVLVYQWGRPDVAAYAVPVALLPELLPYFPER